MLLHFCLRWELMTDHRKQLSFSSVALPSFQTPAFMFGSLAKKKKKLEHNSKHSTINRTVWTFSATLFSFGGRERQELDNRSTHCFIQFALNFYLIIIWQDLWLVPIQYYSKDSPYTILIWLFTLSQKKNNWLSPNQLIGIFHVRCHKVAQKCQPEKVKSSSSDAMRYIFYSIKYWNISLNQADFS